MKIDAYAHIIPPELKDFIWRTCNTSVVERLQQKIGIYTSLYNLDERFRIMDKCPDRVEVLTLAWIAVHDIARTSNEAIELAQRINDSLAELVIKYPDRFVAAAAVLPLKDIDAALSELDRAINHLKLRGLLIRHPVEGKPLDSQEYMPIYERMNQYDLPIFLHPVRDIEFTDYPVLDRSKYDIFRTFGLPYETTATMTHLVFSGVLQEFPNLKILTHHCGGMIPYFAQRIVSHYNMTEQLQKLGFTEGLNAPVIEYFRKFYNDTAIVGNEPALMCAYHFFGADHLLFAHDMPFDAQLGEYGMQKTIEAIERMAIPDTDKEKIFAGNAIRLMRLKVPNG